METAEGAEVLPQHERLSLVERPAALDGVPVGLEHGHVRQLIEHQLQVESADIHPREDRAGDVDEVDLQTVPRDLLAQPGHEAGQTGAAQPPRRVHQIDAEQPQRFLLSLGFRIEQTGVQEDLARLAARPVLELDAQPALAVHPPRVAARRHRVGEHEERGLLPAGPRQGLPQRGVLVLEHLLQSLAAHVAVALAVDAVAHRHVVGADGLGDRAGRAADGEEPARHLLPGADLGQRPVPAGVEIELQGLLAGRERRLGGRRGHHRSQLSHGEGRTGNTQRPAWSSSLARRRASGSSGATCRSFCT